MKKTVPNNAILIPDNATSVFKGILFEVFQWQQKLYDGSEKTFEMIKRPDSVDVLLVRGDDVLILKDEQPNRQSLISLPSGRVDVGENWDKAAERELREETGITCSTWKLVYVVQPLHKLEWFDAIYVATDITETNQQNLDAGEKIELTWRNYQALRVAILDGQESSLDYLAPIVRKAMTTKELIALPQFSGQEVDRE